jgi:PAS domain S-box-containing protein
VAIPPKPGNESQRLAALRQYEILDTLPEQSLDDLTLLAAHICHIPIALISLVDENRQWFKSNIGMPASETPRDISFCGHAILQPDLFIVPDAILDERFAHNPMVVGDPHVRFYAGAPLLAPDGHAIGALCVMDRSPRQLTADQLEALRVLSRQVMSQLELRRHIEEQHRAQLASARLAAIVEFSDDAIIGKDLNSIIASWNRGAEKIFGYTAQEMVGASIMRLIPSDRQAEETHILDTIKRGESVEHFDTVRRTKDGRLIDVSVTASPIKDSSGKIIGVSKVARDVSQKKRADTALKMSEERYRTLFDYAPDGILIATPEGIYLDANASMCVMLGYQRDELLGRRAQDIVAKAEIEQIAPALDAITSHKPYSREWTFRRKDRSEFQAEVIATMMPDGNLLALIRDVTDRKKLEQQFLRAQRMESIGTLAGGIAHDLNNVLAPILMSIEILKDFVTDERGQAFLDTVYTSAQRGSALVKQVLSFARGIEGERVKVNAIHLMRDLFAVMRETFPKSITIRFFASPDLWTVIGDATQMHQVFLNLCVNARDAMPSGGTLEVTMENVVLDDTYAAMNLEATPGPYIMVSVSDTGIGIPPEVRERIFEPFFTTKEVGQGTGLGLSTTLAIMKSHRGFINVYSEVGKGTKFKLYFPADATETAAESVAVERTGLPRGRGELVLVVDDEEALRQIVKGTLERFGYRVMLAKNGAEAVALYAQHRSEIAVVLTDMAMPVLDGPATIVALQLISPSVKIIGTSGLPANGHVAKAVGSGVQHFVPKPYTAETMLRALEQILTNQTVP